MPQIYLYRRGNGNEGNYPRFIVTLADDECAYSAIKALAANERICGSLTRRHIMRNIETDGELEHGIIGTVYEGPDGEDEFGAAWLTCELEPYSADDVARCVNIDSYDSLRDALDNAAWRYYCKESVK